MYLTSNVVSVGCVALNIDSISEPISTTQGSNEDHRPTTQQGRTRSTTRTKVVGFKI